MATKHKKVSKGTKSVKETALTTFKLDNLVPQKYQVVFNISIW